MSSWEVWMELLRIEMGAMCYQGEGSLHYSQLVATAKPRCCVSFSYFCSDIITPYPSCACACQNENNYVISGSRDPKDDDSYNFYQEADGQTDEFVKWAKSEARRLSKATLVRLCYTLLDIYTQVSGQLT